MVTKCINTQKLKVETHQCLPYSPLLSIAEDRVQAVCCGEPLSPGGGQSCSGGQGQGRAVLQVRKRKRETKREGN